jgi:hypothetical protein
MKNLKSLLFIVALSGAFTGSVNAQEYKLAIGARLGYPLAASLKFFIDESSALEGYVGTRWYSNYSWRNLSGAYLYHFPLEGVDGLQLYAGGGASLYFWSYDFQGNNASTSIGIQGYVGLDYAFADVPLNLTFDWVPTLFLNGFDSGLGGRYGSIGVRYILKK